MARISAPRGINLQIYLLGLYEAQTRKRDGMAGPCPLPILGARHETSWSTIVVSAATQNMQAKVPVTAAQNRVRQIKSAFKRLADENLAVRNIGDPANPYPIMLLHESGSAHFETYGYTVPEWYEDSPTTISLPVDFFREGWVYLLTPAEIRMYLVLKHLAGRFPDVHAERGIFCAEQDRKWRYDLSRDVYEAHLTLARFGLVERIEDRSRHADGKMVNYNERMARGEFASPHRFQIAPDNALREPAWEKIKKTLTNYPPTFEQMKRKRG
ncbi:hypothetical protein [Streptomyces sp. MBT33]|uniref:hypothetical protein n=1 Tax=Streptomyces sp. MBT33 TaxID=1488363 RepID=UPI00190DDCF9|nr:hypothetical protein [Streptomyces sp. MBT33]MBK3642965.1 hypothetical protein [Streptomyces sp. MBT33]